MAPKELRKAVRMHPVRTNDLVLIIMRRESPVVYIRESQDRLNARLELLEKRHKVRGTLTSDLFPYLAEWARP